jgi:hypothetical protein
VNDFMERRGWRFDGQQYPSAIHMCVTGPQTSRAWWSASPPTSPRRRPTPAARTSRSLAAARSTAARARATTAGVDLAQLRERLLDYVDSTLEQPAR